MPHSTTSESMLPEASVVGDSALLNAPDDKVDDVSHSEGATDKVMREDVKLEDIFHDLDDDEEDEFLDSRVSNTNNESSPSEVPQ